MVFCTPIGVQQAASTAARARANGKLRIITVRRRELEQIHLNQCRALQSTFLWLHTPLRYAESPAIGTSRFSARASQRRRLTCACAEATVGLNLRGILPARSYDERESLRI